MLKKHMLLMLAVCCLLILPLIAQAESECVPVLRVDLSDTKLQLSPGETWLLYATVAPEAATERGIKYTSDHPDIARVSSNGLITAVSPGTATVRADAIDGSGRSAACVVTVRSAPTPTPKPPKGSMARVDTVSGSLNLRADPKSHAKTLRRIPKGEEIEVLGYGSEWCYVRYKGDAGYVRTEYLVLGTGVKKTNAVVAPTPKHTPTPKTTVKPTPTPKPTRKAALKPGTARVTTARGGLNLRQAASSRAARILIIPRGAIVQVITPGSRWSLVTYNGQTGYVKTQYLGLD